MRELTFPPGVRWRLWWALVLGIVFLGFGLEGREPLFALLGLLFLGAFLVHYRRTGYALTLEPEGVRHQGRLFLRERLREAQLEVLRNRLWLDFGGEGLPLPLGLPGWDEALAHLGVAWREVPGLEAYLLGQRGPVWFWGGLHPPREAQGVHAWALGVYRGHFRRIYGALGLALLGFFLLLPQATETLGLVLLALGGFLFLWWLDNFPHGIASYYRRPKGRYNPLDPEFRRLAEGGKRDEEP